MEYQTEARDIQKEQITNQIALMQASKWKGPYGERLKEEATTEKKLLDLRTKRSNVEAAILNLEIAREGD